MDKYITSEEMIDWLSDAHQIQDVVITSNGNEVTLHYATDESVTGENLRDCLTKAINEQYNYVAKFEGLMNGEEVE